MNQSDIIWVWDNEFKCFNPLINIEDLFEPVVYYTELQFQKEKENMDDVLDELKKIFFGEDIDDK